MNLQVEFVHPSQSARINFLKFVTLVLVAYCYCFVTINMYTSTPFSEMLNTVFVKGPLNSYVSLFGIFVILLLIVWFIASQFNLRATSFGVKLFFTFSVLFSIYKLLNPNNSDYISFLGIPVLFLFENLVGFGILYFMLAMSERDFFHFVRMLLNIMTVMLIVRGIVLGAFWLVGEGNRFFFGVNSILLEYDTLVIYGLFHSLFLAIFFINRKLLFLILSLFFLTIILLSFRRSPLMVCMFSDLFLILTIFVRASLSKKLMVLSIPIMFTLSILVIREVVPSTDFWINRYLGIFTGAEGNKNPGSDSGHFQQTVLTTLGASEIGFWGKGIGKKIELPGAFQKTIIHNIYAAEWAQYGILAFAFYLLLFLYSVFRSIGSLFYASRKSVEYNILAVVPISFYAGYMIAMWFAPSFYVESLKMFFFLTLLMALHLKLNPNIFEKLFPNPRQINSKTTQK